MTYVSVNMELWMGSWNRKRAIMRKSGEITIKFEGVASQ